MDLDALTAAVDLAGYVRVPSVVPLSDVAAVAGEADESLEAVQRVIDSGQRVSLLSLGKSYIASRVLYVWGPASRRLLDVDVIHQLSERLTDGYWLWDLSALSNLPAHNAESSPANHWHRDVRGPGFEVGRATYLWFFLCVDDTTPENGATWVMPGSHRPGTRLPDWNPRTTTQPPPSALQLCGKSGDLLVLNPSALHTAGQNLTDKPRRLVNIGIVARPTVPLFNHRAVGGATLWESASPRVREMLSPDISGLPGTWEVLPPASHVTR